MNLQPTTTAFDSPTEWFAADHVQYQPGGVTIDYTTVPTATGGVRTVLSGAVLGKITASGKYGPYDSGASDGRQTATGLAVIAEGSLVCTSADIGVGMLIHGFVKEAALPDTITATIKGHVPLIKFL